MNILFLHPNFPAQFANLAHFLGRSSQHKIVYITNNPQGEIPGVQKIIFGESTNKVVAGHHYLQSTEQALEQGQRVAQVALKLKQEGFIPDLIIGHSGWGATMFIKEVFQKPFVGYFEWFNVPRGTVHDFDPKQPLTVDAACQIHTANIPILLDLVSCDAGVTPTNWQYSSFPQEYKEKIMVLHEGVHTDVIVPKVGAKLVLPGLDLSKAKEIITYVGRGLEPYRGFPQFMESVALLLKRRPECHVVIVGEDRIAYGSKPAPGGRTYKQWMLEKLELDMTRVHFTGLLPRQQYLQVLQASDVHIYLTYPFVLSWSMLEAMSAGCLVVGSATPPVQEVLKHGENGLLVDFFSPEGIADTVEYALQHPEDMKKLRGRAREAVVERFALANVMPKWMSFLQRVIEQR